MARAEINYDDPDDPHIRKRTTADMWPPDPPLWRRVVVPAVLAMLVLAAVVAVIL